MLFQSQLRSLLRYHYVDNRDGTTGGASTSGIGSAAPSSSTPQCFRFRKCGVPPSFSIFRHFCSIPSGSVSTMRGCSQWYL